MPAFIHTLKKVPFTAMIGVNTLYNGLLNAPGFAELNLHRAEAVRRGRHGRAARGRASGGSRRPACRSSRATG